MEISKPLKAVFGERNLAEAIMDGKEVDIDAWKGVIDEAWSGNVHRWSTTLDAMNADRDASVRKTVEETAC